MKRFVTLALVAAGAMGSLAASNIGIDVLASGLAEAREFVATADYAILLPSADEPISYRVTMAASANAADSLSAADYLLEWSLVNDGKSSDGFTAYFDGNYYRYRDQLLREYHFDSEPEVFAPIGDASKGMQNQAQFGNLLPHFIARDLRTMASDSTYHYCVHADTVVAGQRTIVVDGVRSYLGEVVQHFMYVFDRDMLPVSIEITNNPGRGGEQVLSASYDYSGDLSMPAFTEESIAERYPEAFAKFRVSTFTLANLPGRRLPEFSSPTPTGERYTFTKTSQFARPTVIAILNTDDDSTSGLIAALRDEVDRMDEKTDLILAFINNNAEAVEATAGQLRPGEHVLMSARGLARDCDVTATPVVILCEADGTVISADAQQ